MSLGTVSVIRSVQNKLVRCVGINRFMKGVVSKETVVLRRKYCTKIGFINGVDNVNWPRIEKLMFRALALCQSDGLSLHLGTTESRKNLENPHGINERFSFNECIPIFHVAMLPPIA